MMSSLHWPPVIGHLNNRVIFRTIQPASLSLWLNAQRCSLSWKWCFCWQKSTF